MMKTENIKTAIVCDNYKLEKYKKELRKRGFNKLITEPFKNDCTTIGIECKATDIPEIQRMCQILEAQFKRRN